jgi:hypothetical protein
MKKSELKQLIREIIKEQYTFTDKGLVKTQGSEIQIVPGGAYHLGASSSPDHIIVTKVTPERFWYRSYPYKKDQVIETWIGKDLIKSGMENWLKSGYPQHHPKRAKAYKQALAGGKPYMQKLEDYQYWDIKIKGDEGVDVYGVAKAYGVAKDWDDKENTATAEVMKQYIPQITREKGIKILSKKKV